MSKINKSYCGFLIRLIFIIKIFGYKFNLSCSLVQVNNESLSS